MEEKTTIWQDLLSLQCDLDKATETLSLIADGISYNDREDCSIPDAINLVNDYLKDIIESSICALMDRVRKECPNQLGEEA